MQFFANWLKLFNFARAIAGKRMHLFQLNSEENYRMLHGRKVDFTSCNFAQAKQSPQNYTRWKSITFLPCWVIYYFSRLRWNSQIPCVQLKSEEKYRMLHGSKVNFTSLNFAALASLVKNSTRWKSLTVLPCWVIYYFFRLRWNSRIPCVQCVRETANFKSSPYHSLIPGRNEGYFSLSLSRSASKSKIVLHWLILL